MVSYWTNKGLHDFQNGALKKLGAESPSDVCGVCMKYPGHFASKCPALWKVLDTFSVIGREQ